MTTDKDRAFAAWRNAERAYRQELDKEVWGSWENDTLQPLPTPQKTLRRLREAAQDAQDAFEALLLDDRSSQDRPDS